MNLATLARRYTRARSAADRHATRRDEYAARIIAELAMTTAPLVTVGAFVIRRDAVGLDVTERPAPDCRQLPLPHVPQEAST